MSVSNNADAVAPSSEGATGVGAHDLDVPQAGIGWLRAIASGLGILVVGFAVTIGVTNWLLTDGSLSSLSRDNRVWMAAALFLVAVVVMAWVLRRLQARGLI